MLVAIALGAKDVGINKIEYPVFQAFTHYLQQREGLFQDYIFNGKAWPKKQGEEEAIEFPESVEMTEDLNRLVGFGLLEEVPDSTDYALTMTAEMLRDRYIGKLEAKGVLTFDELRGMAGGLLSAPEGLMQYSYQQYINTLGTKKAF